MQIITLTSMYSPEWLMWKGQKMPNIGEAKEVLELSYSTRESVNQDSHFGGKNLTVSPKDGPTSPLLQDEGLWLINPSVPSAQHGAWHGDKLNVC